MVDELPGTLEQDEKAHQRIRRHNRSLLLETVALSGLSERQFAIQELHVNERTFRRWKEGAEIKESTMALVRARHREMMRIQIRRERQGVSAKNQKAKLLAAAAKRQRRGNRNV